MKEAWDLAVRNNMAWIDTAQAYGSGESERIIGELIKDLPREKYQIQTKWYVIPDNMTNLLHPRSAPAKMLKSTLERLRLDYIGWFNLGILSPLMQDRMLPCTWPYSCQ